MKLPWRFVRPFAFLIVVCSLTAPVRAENSLVALAQVTNGGSLQGAASPIGASVTSLAVATGSYDVVITLAGAFVGANTTDFVVETTNNSVNTGDTSLTAAIVSLTADELTVRVRSNDVQVEMPPDIAVAKSAYFVLAVHRLDHLVDGAPIDSPYVLAVGSVAINGELDSGFGVEGHSMITGRSSTGRYFLNPFKQGAFTSDSPSNYLLFLSNASNALPDVGIRGGPFHALGDDYANFVVFTDDVQSAPASDNPVAANAPFSFLIYRMVPQETGEPRSRLLAGLASVNGANGNLIAGKTGLRGGSVSSTRVSPGVYRVFFDSPGAFAGASDERFVPLLTIINSNLSDDIIKGRAVVINENRLRVDVTIDDVQHNGDGDGIPADGSFFLTLYDSGSPLRHDLSVGPKATGTGSRGRGILNPTGAGQALNLPLKERKARSVFYQSVNVGPSIDDLRLRSAGTSPKLGVQFFATTGLRRNVTALAKTGAVVETGLLPDDTRNLQGVVRYKSKKKRRNAVVALRAVSGYNVTGQDTNLVRTKPK